MNDITVCTDDELMLLARRGVPASFDTLVRRHQSRALNLATRFVGNGSLAADVVQDTFWQVHRALDAYQPNGKFGPYLRSVLINQCRMAYRRTVAENRCRRDLVLVHSEHQYGADADYLARELQQQVESALGKLGEKLRIVVVLRVSSGFSYCQIAETLSIPVGTVKRRMFEAMAKLRCVLNDPCATLSPLLGDSGSDEGAMIGRNAFRRALLPHDPS